MTSRGYLNRDVCGSSTREQIRLWSRTERLESITWIGRLRRGSAEQRMDHESRRHQHNETPSDGESLGSHSCYPWAKGPEFCQKVRRLEMRRRSLFGGKPYRTSV